MSFATSARSALDSIDKISFLHSISMVLRLYMSVSVTASPEATCAALPGHGAAVQGFH